MSVLHLVWFEELSSSLHNLITLHIINYQHFTMRGDMGINFMSLWKVNKMVRGARAVRTYRL